MADAKPLERTAPAPPAAASTAPFWGLVAALLALAGLFLVRPWVQEAPAFRPRPGPRTYDHWPYVLAAFVPYAGALVAAVRGMRVSRAALIGAAIAVSLAYVPAPPQQSQDVYQYLLYGRMAADGLSPYALAPSEAPSPWLAYSSWPDTPSVYGPIWTLASHVAVELGGGLAAALLLQKGLAGGLLIAAAAGLHRAAQERGRPGWTGPTFVVVAFAFNPMVVVSNGLGAHADIGVAAAFAWAVVAERRGRPGWTTALLAAATLIKLYAGLALLVWLAAVGRRRGAGHALRHAAACCAGAVAALAPYWEGGATLRGLSEVGRGISASALGTLVRLLSGRADGAFAPGSMAATIGRAGAVAVLLVVVAWAVRTPRVARDPWGVAATAFAVYVLVTPWYLYWHLLGPLVLVILAAERALTFGALTFSATSLVSIEPGVVGTATTSLLVQTGVRYGPPAAAWVATRRGYTRARGDLGAGSDGGRLRGGDPAARGARTAGDPGDA